MQSFADTWIEQGIEQGKQEGIALLTLRQLQRRFGIFDAETQEIIRIMPIEKLERLGEELLDFSTHDNLVAWLRENTSDHSQ